MDTATTRTPNPYTITYALIAINVLVYLAMIARGLSPTEPTPQNILDWGGDYGPATLGLHQYWRLFTSTFLHFGIIHIAFNMYVLYQIGPFIETVFGRDRYLVIYFLAGLGGSIVSVLVHPQAVGAGASGAIFGLYGAVFGFLLIRRRVLNPTAVRASASPQESLSSTTSSTAPSAEPPTSPPTSEGSSPASSLACSSSAPAPQPSTSEKPVKPPSRSKSPQS